MFTLPTPTRSAKSADRPPALWRILSRHRRCAPMLGVGVCCYARLCPALPAMARQLAASAE